MTIGLSSYAFLWHRAELGIPGMLRATRDLGCDLLQLCDLPQLEDATDPELLEIRASADALGVRLETGTKGVRPEHLERHLRIATALGAPLVRSMLSGPQDRPSLEEAIGSLREILPAYAAAGITLGLETYEQYSTDDLVQVVRTLDDPRLGIVLDPGNSVARLEHPRDVVAATAPHVVGLHVKDFAFTRGPSMVGFTLAGAPLGEGLLDYDGICDALDADGRSVHHVVEHWLTPQETPEATRALETTWVADSVRYLRDRDRAGSTPRTTVAHQPAHQRARHAAPRPATHSAPQPQEHTP